ncbi:MAG TPA: cysteine rich repeat-containing protein [Candidatus Acidoferrum sp.]|jgi:hypothetical protein
MKVRRIANASFLLLSLTVSSVCAAATPQSAQSGDQQSLDAIRAACADDAQKLCAGVQPGGGRIVACLKEHKDSLSDRCKQAAGLAANPNSSSPRGPAASPITPSGPVAGPSVSVPDSHTKPATAPKSDPERVILGERFVKRTLVDTQQGGMTAVTIHLPESWHFEGNIEWHYGWVEVPVNPSWHAENPANAEAYFQYPALRLVNVDVAPQWRQYVKSPKPGERGPTGQINMAPVPPLQAMALFIKKVRGDVSNLKWLGQQDLPDLAKALRLDPSPNQHGVAIKIGYDLNGQPVEEAFFGVYYLNKAGTPAVQTGHQSMAANQLVQTNWGFQALQSFRAPAGTLDKRMPVYCLIGKSVQYDPQWTARYRAIEATLVQMFNQKLQQGWDQIRAADAISDQAMRDNAKFLDNIGRQEIAMRSSGGGGGSSGGSGGDFLRNEGHDGFSDLMRNVDTVNDSSTGGTKEVSNLGGYNHFTNGFGDYRTYDNPNDTPENQGENGTWQRMTPAP